MPSCRQCNFYKSASGIKGFRKKIKDVLSRTCIDTVQARLALKYGILTHRPWDGRFYFERDGEEDGIPEDVIEYLQKETGMEP